MQRSVPLAQASSEEAVLSTRVQEAVGQLVSSAKEGLLALSVGVGLGLLAELPEEVVDVLGPKGKHDRAPSTNSNGLPASSTAATPARPARCAKAWKRRSPSLGSASPAR